MNHLKPFLEYYNNPYYKEIEHDDYYRILFKNKGLNRFVFYKDNLDELISILNHNGYTSEKNIKNPYYLIETQGIFLNPNPIKNGLIESITIYEIPDEWYLVKIHDTYTDLSNYYKCDQFEGLLKFLKDINYGKS